MSVRSFEQNQASPEDRSFGSDAADAPKGYKVWRIDLGWTTNQKGQLGQDVASPADAPSETKPGALPRR